MVRLRLTLVALYFAAVPTQLAVASGQAGSGSSTEHLFAQGFETPNFHEPIVVEHLISSNLTQLIAADLDGDQHVDLVSTTIAGSLRWHRNMGAQQFAVAQTLATGLGRPFFIDTGDVDNDGNLDLLICDNSDNQSRIVMIPGAGLAQTVLVSQIPLGVFRAYFVDFDRDGDLDVLWNSDTAIQWLRNAGDGQFSAPIPLLGSAEFYNLALGKLNSDAFLDFAIVSSSGTQLLFNAGGAIAPALVVNPTISGFVTLADLDADGLDDVAIADTIKQQLKIYKNAKGGAFSSVQPVHMPLANIQNLPLAFVGLDQSSALDLVYATVDGLFVRTGLGGASFGSEQQIVSKIRLQHIDFADLDNDGDQDVMWYGFDGENRGVLGISINALIANVLGKGNEKLLGKRFAQEN